MTKQHYSDGKWRTCVAEKCPLGGTHIRDYKFDLPAKEKEDKFRLHARSTAVWLEKGKEKRGTVMLFKDPETGEYVVEGLNHVSSKRQTKTTIPGRTERKFLRTTKHPDVHGPVKTYEEARDAGVALLRRMNPQVEEIQVQEHSNYTVGRKIAGITKLIIAENRVSKNLKVPSLLESYTTKPLKSLLFQEDF